MEAVFAQRRNRIFRPHLPDKPLDIDDFVEMAQNVTKARKRVWTLRLAALYVDRIDGNWTSPLDITVTDVTKWLDKATQYHQTIDFQTRNIIHAPQETAQHYQSWIHDTLMPFAQDYLHNHLNALLAEGIISQQLYDTIKAI